MNIALFNIADYHIPSEHPSLGLGYIASFLRKKSGIKEARVLAGNVLSQLEREPPDIIGISSVTQDFPRAAQYAGFLKQKFRVPVIVGGVHISSLPHRLPEAFDLAVLGEGEETIRELIETISAWGWDEKRLALIKGIVYHQEGRVVVNPPRQIITDMDSIPFPVRSGFHRHGFFHILTSRGCPYRCSFCSSSRFWNKVRFFSAQYVIEEILHLITDYKARHISIWDDIFIANLRRFREIVSLIRRKNIHRRISFGCSVRANLVTEEVCSLMKQMNITHVDMGLESGSDRMLKFLKKDTVDVAANRRAVEQLKQHGFVTRASFIVGSPGETSEDMTQTLEFIKQSRLDGGVVNLAVPYPGTEFWQDASRRGLISEEMDFSRLAIVTRFSELPADDFLLLSDKVTREEFLRIARAIEFELARRNTASLFSLKNLNFKNIRLAFLNPGLAIKIIRESFGGLKKRVKKNV
ncbi:MAG: B12-binding domain-containing radical SAM protein [Candidatus Omnitrophota bacterium]